MTAVTDFFGDSLPEAKAIAARYIAAGIPAKATVWATFFYPSGVDLRLVRGYRRGQTPWTLAQILEADSAGSAQ